MLVEFSRFKKSLDCLSLAAQNKQMARCLSLRISNPIPRLSCLNSFLSNWSPRKALVTLSLIHFLVFRNAMPVLHVKIRLCSVTTITPNERDGSSLYHDTAVLKRPHLPGNMPISIRC